MKVAYSRQPLVNQIAADFTTEYGTRYQILASTDSTTVHYGVRHEAAGGGWNYGTFSYAEGWRERNGYPQVWTGTVFRRMITDFVKGDQP